MSDFRTGQKMQYFGNFEISTDMIVQVPEIHSKNDDVVYCDLVLQFFIAKTKRVLEIGAWDVNFKTVEHSDFFLNARKHGLKVAYTGGVNVLHEQYRDANYQQYRCGAANKYVRMLLEKWNVKKLITLTGASHKIG